jgi:hypothetical protein
MVWNSSIISRSTSRIWSTVTDGIMLGQDRTHLGMLGPIPSLVGIAIQH